MVAASYPELIASVEARADLAVVRRGAAPVAEAFDVSSSYRAAGRNFGEYGLPAPPQRRLIDRAAEIVRNEGMTGPGGRIARRLRSKRAS